MTWNFADSFDLYTATADMVNGYWDSGSNNGSFVTGRFTGSRALSLGSIGALVKSSAVNDAVHHFVVSYEQTAAISGTTLGFYIELFDAATAQCSIVFKSNGDILLTSGGPGGSVLDTYTGAVGTNNTWFAFEFEVVINNSTGSWAVRKNGNNSNDHSLGSLNTRGSSNNYANKIQMGESAGVSTQIIDDFFWQSGASTGAWLGDIRCYTRMPATDSSVAFSKSPLTATQSTAANNSTATTSATSAYYTSLTPTYDGTIGSLVLLLNAGFTGNLKCTIFNDNAGVPGTVLSSAVTLNNPATGSNTFTFSSPPTVSRSSLYWVGVAADGAYTAALAVRSTGTTARLSTTAYASFPVATPTTIAGVGLFYTWTITIVGNYNVVNEAQEDSGTTYVYDSNPGDADFYGIATITTTPATVIATVVRAYMMKSDAGTRTAAVQLKSGGTTVASTTTALTTSGWQWLYRMDLTDPNTSVAWTPTGVTNALIGPTVIA